MTTHKYVLEWQTHTLLCVNCAVEVANFRHPTATLADVQKAATDHQQCSELSWGDTILRCELEPGHAPYPGRGGVGSGKTWDHAAPSYGAYWMEWR